jgi:hypothetical protein
VSTWAQWHANPSLGDAARWTCLHWRSPAALPIDVALVVGTTRPRTVPVFDVSMTDPIAGREPVPLTPPSQPITGDSHGHLITPLIAHAAELGYTVEIRDLSCDGARS